jgi:uncharacterized protein
VKRSATILTALAVPLLLAGVLFGPGAASAAGSSTGAWVDSPVSFSAGGLTIYGTYRHPAHRSGPFPAALLIAGSGPTDRNGNSPEEAGPVDTIKTLADWLSQDGVASLRYDKLGSGKTGLGRFVFDPDAIGIKPFEAEATAALTYLARQRGVDRARLAVVGHSEGALFALLVATGAAGAAPPVHALALLEPLALRYLDVISDQITGQVQAAEAAGQLTAAAGTGLDQELAAIVASLRADGKLPANVPADLASVFSPATSLFLSQADRYDPGQLAVRLRRGLPVLVSCSNDDIQVTCGEVDHLVAGLTAARAGTDFVQLVGVDHVLKEDPSLTAANYTKPLPFSTQLRAAIASFAEKNL